MATVGTSTMCGRALRISCCRVTWFELSGEEGSCMLTRGNVGWVRFAQRSVRSLPRRACFEVEALRAHRGIEWLWAGARDEGVAFKRYGAAFRQGKYHGTTVSSSMRVLEEGFARSSTYTQLMAPLQRILLGKTGGGGISLRQGLRRTVNTTTHFKADTQIHCHTAELGEEKSHAIIRPELPVYGTMLTIYNTHQHH